MHSLFHVAVALLHSFPWPPGTGMHAMGKQCRVRALLVFAGCVAPTRELHMFTVTVAFTCDPCRIALILSGEQGTR